MYTEFRVTVKRIMRERKINYNDLEAKAAYSFHTIKNFANGHNDSHSVAIAIAKALDLTLIYSGGKVKVVEE